MTIKFNTVEKGKELEYAVIKNAETLAIFNDKSLALEFACKYECEVFKIKDWGITNIYCTKEE